MYPLDFEEFMWAVGNDTMIDLIKDCYNGKKPMGQALHRKAMDYFRQYMIVRELVKDRRFITNGNRFSDFQEQRKQQAQYFADRS